MSSKLTVKEMRSHLKLLRDAKLAIYKLTTMKDGADLVQCQTMLDYLSDEIAKMGAILTLEPQPGETRHAACTCSKVIQDSEGNAISGLTDQILGADDEWYCSVCESIHYRACVSWYLKDV